MKVDGENMQSEQIAV